MILRAILYWIRRADQETIDRILEAAVERRKILFPQWDMLYIALPKEDHEERKRITENILKYLEK